MLAATDMNGGAITPQPQSADRIRERFLNKIGIEGPQHAAQQHTGSDDAIHDGPIDDQPPSCCLGDVVPTFEPLKACLEDDSSIEGSDNEFDDDDFFFGNDEDIESMAIDYFNKTHTPATGSRKTSMVSPLSPVPSGSSAPSLATVTDEGSSLSSTSEVSSMMTDNSSSASLRGFHSYSTGAISQYSHSSSKSGKRKSKRRVSIHNDVAVVPIPSRTEYSGRIRERLWSSGAELYQNAARNSIEFAAEGWNWRNVTEDEHMLVHTVSGELIHPIHLHNALQMNVMSETPASLPVIPNVASDSAVSAASQTASA